MMLRWISTLAFAASVMACRTAGPAKVPEADADLFVRRLRTIALADPDQRLGLLALACADVASCSGGCAPAFKAFASESEDQRGESMLACPAFDKYSKGANTNELRDLSRDWVHLELRAYALRIERDEQRAAQRVLETLDRAIAGQPPYWED